MNYPVWYLPSVGGGSLIAIIAIAHVVIAHLAVGGGLFLVLTERKAVKSKNAALLDYVKKHTNFFLLLTMVFGGVSGVGIWFIIALVNPAATSMLIHTFVFGWAVEWVFFIGEIVALLIYYSRFDKMSSRNHMILGWLYFIFAWLSLFVINGILGFMLTPGKWLETANFWHGFFNPGFLPSLIFRTCIAIIFAGVFGLVTASFLKDKELRASVFRYCAKYMYLPVAVLALTGLYYTRVISEEAFLNLFHFNRESSPFINVLVIASFLLFGIGLFTLFRFPRILQKIGAFLLVIISFAWMAGFEYMREIARKPYVLYENMYSNSVRPENNEKISEVGFLKSASWSKIKVVTDQNYIQAGEEIFRIQCMACHTIKNYNGVKSLSDKLTQRGLEAFLTGMGKVNTYMPPFMGTEKEKEALAAYIFEEIQEKSHLRSTEVNPGDFNTEVPDFSNAKDDYVLLVWNDLGMHCISDNEKYFSFLPPANTFNAQLFKRGSKPELIKTGVYITYSPEAEHENPQNHSMFWDYDEAIFGVDLPEGIGLSGKGLTDTMDLQGNMYAAHLFPVTPYRDDKKYNPYPVFTIKAIDQTTGDMLAETKAVAPTSTEMGCRNCHEGGWAWNDVSGMADLTAQNILAVHDRYNNTSLLEDAENGSPALCQSCHADPAVNAQGKDEILNFSAAMHGFHANYLTGMDQEACNLCHPSSVDGNTNCYRGRHSGTGLNCTNCHGRMEDHALGLLAAQKGNEAAERLSRNLNPVFIAKKEDIIPRQPWLMEPDCRSCHTNFSIREDGFKGTSFNMWADGFNSLYRNRTDAHGVMCIACHGSTHAVYGARNKYELQRDNLQPLQYQGLAGTVGTHDNCQVCHKKKMTLNGHHRNMVLRENIVSVVK
ncbi:MAG TPA: cytochrome ubiquinol oxidase subunit I [Bacteroidales bacterium]|nr:cytochrome ubiquinol oxidase subunit I [Bacteroidales bacterium]